MRLIDTVDCGEKGCRIGMLIAGNRSDGTVIWPQEIKQLVGMQGFSRWEVYIKFKDGGTRAKQFTVCSIHGQEMHKYWVGDITNDVLTTEATDKWQCRLEGQGDDF